MCQVSTSGCNTWVSGGWGRNITKFIRSNKKKHWHSREICWILNTLLISVPNRILLMSVISSVETNSGRINWSPLSKAISSLPCFWRILVRENFEANAWCEEHASFDVIYGRYPKSTSKFYLASSNVLPVLKSEFSLNFLQRMALYAPTFLQGLQLGSKNVVFKPSMFAISNRWASGKNPTSRRPLSHGRNIYERFWIEDGCNPGTSIQRRQTESSHHGQC